MTGHGQAPLTSAGQGEGALLDGGRWRVLVAGLPLQVAFGLALAWGAVAPRVAAGEGWSRLAVGAVFSGVPVGYGTGMLLGGWLADRFAPRPLTWLSWAVGVGGVTVGLLWPAPLVFVLVYSGLGLGVGGGLALSATVAAAARVFPERRGTVAGLLSACYAGGPLLQAPAVDLLAGRWGWHAALSATAATGGVVSGAALLLLPRLPRPVPHQHLRPPSLARLVRRRPLWTVAVVVMTVTPLGTYSFVGAGLAAHAARLPALAVTAAVIAVPVGNVVGRVSAGWLSDREPPGRLLLAVTGGNLLAQVVLLAGPATLLPAGALAAGLMLGLAVGCTPRAAAQAAPEAPGSGFGLLFTAYCVGAAGGPLLGAAAPGRWAWLAAGLPALLAVAVWAVPGTRAALLR